MEFISSEAITRGNARQLRKLVFDEEERPLSIQIYGSSVERMAAAADIVSSVRRLRHQHRNLRQQGAKGCAGAALMGDPDLAKEMIREVKVT